jgi:hypothetical protein
MTSGVPAEGEKPATTFLTLDIGPAFGAFSAGVVPNKRAANTRICFHIRRA